MGRAAHQSSTPVEGTTNPAGASVDTLSLDVHLGVGTSTGDITIESSDDLQLPDMVERHPARREMEKLDPRYVTALRESGALWSIVLSLFWGSCFAALILWSDLPDVWHVPLMLAWLVLTVAHVWWRWFRAQLLYRYAAFHVDDEQIEIHRGFFVRAIINIPRSRVQHTDVSQGPFERRHGLGTLQIYTAGVSHAVVPLAGLEHSRALAIRDLLLPRERPAHR